MRFSRKLYGIDTRSINFFRIVLGVVMIGHMIGYVLANFTTMFSPETGVLGNGFAKDYLDVYVAPQWLFKINTDGEMLCFIGIRLVFLLLFVLGYYPRIAAFVSALLLWLFQLRFNVLFLGWEMFAAVLISFSVFFPWHKNISERKEWRSPMAFVMLFQIGFIYFYNGISKNGEKWMNGTAVKFVLAEFDKAKPLAHKVIEWDLLMSLFTYSTIVIEIAIPLLLFVPFKNKLIRYVVIAFILCLHWGIDFFVDVGYFKWYATCIAALLLPESFWNTHLLRMESVVKWLYPKRTITIPKKRIFSVLEKALTVYLLFMIVITNLNQTVTSKTNDRIGRALNKSHLHHPIKRVTPSWWPEYSFMRQFWHLYSPDPPIEKGYGQYEIITETDTFRVSNGVPLTDGQLYSSAPDKHLMMYLTLRGSRNKREQIARKNKLMYEIKAWNKNENNPPMKAVEIVLYSYRPQTSSMIKRGEPRFNRTVLQKIDVSYTK